MTATEFQVSRNHGNAYLAWSNPLKPPTQKRGFKELSRAFKAASLQGFFGGQISMHEILNQSLNLEGRYRNKSK